MEVSLRFPCIYPLIIRYLLIVILVALHVWSATVKAAKLAIVIDDFGYRPHNERQILDLPVPLTVSVLPDAPYARTMANEAHQQGHQVLIHMPMAPQSKQPLEKDTLFPDMTTAEIRRIIQHAINNVPYAVGMNNHMGSAMTSSFSGMQKVMQVLAETPLFFLDSKTIASSKVSQAAHINGVPMISRDVFLDDQQNETEIRQQWQHAIRLARHKGVAIAIAHPHTATVRVLQQEISHLPADIQLVFVSSLPGLSPQPVVAVGVCHTEQPIPTVPISRFLLILWQSLRTVMFAD